MRQSRSVRYKAEGKDVRRMAQQKGVKAMSEIDKRRRGLMAAGMVTAAGAGLSGCGGGSDAGSVVVGPGTPAASAPPLTKGEASEWEMLIGSSFTIAGEKGRVNATLVSVKRAPADTHRPASLARQQPFIAYFEMDPDLTPVGGLTYALSHPVRGAFELFLGQADVSAGHGVMTAVLN